MHKSSLLPSENICGVFLNILRELIKIDKVTPEFEIKPELICGIEVQINHYKMVWHVSGYLREID